MSSATINPISPPRFAAALRDLPLDALHAKAAELANSVAHLRSSNAQMLPFAEAGDQDCKDAMFENLGVIGRINERVRLIKAEVEGRGMMFPTSGTEMEVDENGNGESKGVNGVMNGDGDRRGRAGENVDGDRHQTSETRTPSRATNGRLTDEELRRQLELQMAEDEEGVHL